MGEISNRDKDEPTQEQGVSMTEHLAESFHPITACVGTIEQYNKETTEILDIMGRGHNVNFYSDPNKLDRAGFKNAGEKTYVISSIDGMPKFTGELYNCTSLVAVGREISTGAEISFLTHQNPTRVNGLLKKSFVRHLKESLDEFKKRCVPGSIDVVIAGGHFYKGDSTEYPKTLEILDSVVKEELDFEPLVIAGPKDSDSDDIYFDTQRRRLYIIRPDSSRPEPYGQPILHNEPFKTVSSRIKEMEKKWKKEEKRHDAAKEKKN